MIIQKKPDYLIFADTAKKGENIDFPDVSRGWGITIDQTASKPPMEWMNGAFNRIDKNILYLLQQGVPEWSELVTYPENAIIKYNGVLYIAIVENDNAKPASNTSKWQRLQADYFNALPAQKITNGNGPIYEVGEITNFKKRPTVNNSELVIKNDYSYEITDDAIILRRPDGLIIQYFKAMYYGADGIRGTVVSIPVSFNENFYFAIANDGADGCHVVSALPNTLTTARIFGKAGDNYTNSWLQIIAVGR